MGHTYRKNSSKFDDEGTVWRAGKHPKHSNNRKQGGLKTLNSYVEEDYEDTLDLQDDKEYNYTSKHTKNTS